MSQIFDALIRSEAERAGGNSVAQVDATELLRSVESASASNPSILSTQAHSQTVGQDAFLLDTPALASYANVFNAANGQSRQAAHADRADIWKQFKPLSLAPQPEGRLVCLTEKGSPAAEAFRLTGVRLKDLRQVRPLQKVLITSTVPREGKSTVAANLACVLASKSGDKVLLLEGDIRRPSLSQIFNLGKVAGICELLRGECSLHDSIYRLEGAGIWIMPAGSSPAMPLELLQSTKLPALMDQLASLFDWIIVDSPPVLPLADTSIWMRMADGILLVTRQGVSEKKQLQRGLKALESEKMIGALLNCLQDTDYSKYYYRPSESTESLTT